METANTDQSYQRDCIEAERRVCTIRCLPRVGVRSQEPGVRSQESGARSQESGVRSQESGVRSQESKLANVSSTEPCENKEESFAKLNIIDLISSTIKPELLVAVLIK